MREIVDVFSILLLMYIVVVGYVYYKFEKKDDDF